MQLAPAAPWQILLWDPLKKKDVNRNWEVYNKDVHKTMGGNKPTLENRNRYLKLCARYNKILHGTFAEGKRGCDGAYMVAITKASQSIHL